MSAEPEPTLSDVERLAQEAGERLIQTERRRIAEALRQQAFEWREHAYSFECGDGWEREAWESAAGDLKELAARVEKGEFRV
jgi:hypothetical protein